VVERIASGRSDDEHGVLGGQLQSLQVQARVLPALYKSSKDKEDKAKKQVSTGSSTEKRRVRAKEAK
jgi:hypothetical protein